MRAMVVGGDIDSVILQASPDEIARYGKGSVVSVASLEGWACRRGWTGQLEFVGPDGQVLPIVNAAGPAAPRPGAGKTFCTFCGIRFPPRPEAQQNGRIHCKECGRWT